ncbi:hypothetical protein TIFTF001_009018 [Ficus carica]|uniref:Uncharacterized protein n=1 Tax=Ficus carica TaxID=3494 RepID=A0AA88D282_FICCA|nr:hypothetical protein TIFTF001_009018 [Ficus carica]
MSSEELRPAKATATAEGGAGQGYGNLPSVMEVGNRYCTDWVRLFGEDVEMGWRFGLMGLLSPFPKRSGLLWSIGPLCRDNNRTENAFPSPSPSPLKERRRQERDQRIHIKSIFPIIITIPTIIFIIDKIFNK